MYIHVLLYVLVLYVHTCAAVRVCTCTCTILLLNRRSSFYPHTHWCVHTDMRLMPGDELRLRYVGNLRSRWDSVGHVVKVPNSILKEE